MSVAGFLPVIALNTYSAMLTLLTAVDSFRRIRPTRGARVAAVLAISGVLLACALLARGNGIALLSTFLVLLLYFLVPWTAVNLVDYFLVRKGRYAIPHFFTPKGIYGAWQARGIAAYLIGFASMVPFFHIVDAASGQAIFVGMSRNGCTAWISPGWSACSSPDRSTSRWVVPSTCARKRVIAGIRDSDLASMAQHIAEIEQ